MLKTPPDCMWKLNPSTWQMQSAPTQLTNNPSAKVAFPSQGWDSLLTPPCLLLWFGAGLGLRQYFLMKERPNLVANCAFGISSTFGFLWVCLKAISNLQVFLHSCRAVTPFLFVFIQHLAKWVPSLTGSPRFCCNVSNINSIGYIFNPCTNDLLRGTNISVS